MCVRVQLRLLKGRKIESVDKCGFAQGGYTEDMLDIWTFNENLRNGRYFHLFYCCFFASWTIWPIISKLISLGTLPFFIHSFHLDFIEPRIVSALFIDCSVIFSYGACHWHCNWILQLNIAIGCFNAHSFCLLLSAKRFLCVYVCCL